ADRVELEPRGLDRAQLVCMEARELPNVAVQRAGEADDGFGVQPPRSEHGRKSVEISVPVGSDDLLRTHGLIVPFHQRRSDATPAHFRAPYVRISRVGSTRGGGWVCLNRRA